MIFVNSTIGMLRRKLRGMQVTDARYVTIAVIVIAVGYIHFNLGLKEKKKKEEEERD